MSNRNAERTKLLIVGAQGPQVESLSQQLISTKQNLDIVLTTSPEEALGLIQSDNFNIVITEHFLENMDALEFAFHIRKTKSVKPEIILLNDHEKISIHECHQVGISQVVSAPVNIAELMAAIESHSPHARRFGHVDLTPQILGPIFGKVIGKKPPHKIFKLEVSQIGRGGFFYRLKDNTSLPDVGQIVDFEVTLGMVPNTVVKGTGIIRWSRYEGGHHGFGIEFLSLPEESERLIHAFVELFKIQPYVPDIDQAS